MTTVAHSIYGVPQTINTANYVYFQAFQELAALQSMTDNNATGRGLGRIESLESIVNGMSSYSHGFLLLTFLAELLSLHRGQGLELFWRDSLTCPTEEEYMGMVNNSGTVRFEANIES